MSRLDTCATTCWSYVLLWRHYAISALSHRQTQHWLPSRHWTAVLNFSSNMLMFDMSHVQYGHIVVALAHHCGFCGGSFPSFAPPLHTDCLDEYSINSIYTHFKCLAVCLQKFSHSFTIFFIKYKYTALLVRSHNK